MKGSLCGHIRRLHYFFKMLHTNPHNALFTWLRVGVRAGLQFGLVVLKGRSRNL
jgi:hypothetical protein